MNYAHILFLDFDGPLYPEKILLIPENNKDNSMLRNLSLHPMVTYWKMDLATIAMLNQLYEIRPYFIVVSSSWADLHTKEQIESLLALNGLNIPLHKNWKLDCENLSRGERIKEWLDKNKIADYIILDDEDSGYVFQNLDYLKNLNLDKNKIVLCSLEDGVTMSNYYKMKAIIANWK